MTNSLELRTKQKQKCFAEWMEGDHLLVHLDSRAEGVEVPEYLKNNASLTLKLSYLFQGKTEHDDMGITAYLRFSGDYFRCVIPWGCVWGMTKAEGENRLWTEDVPREVILQLARARFSEITGRLFSRRKKEEAEEQEVNEKPPRKSPHLKRVK